MIPTEIAPPRFRTIENARLFEKCLADRTPFPADKWVCPYKLVDGVAIVNPEYRDAPYEMGYFFKAVDRESQFLVNV